jgi:hypothetical protein
MVLSAGGCAAPSNSTANPLEIDRSEYGRMFTASVEVLREHGFVVDRQDYRYGMVSSRARTSPTLMEPWYGDNTTVGQAIESTANNQRRVITVSLEPAPVEPEAEAPTDSAAATDAPAPAQVAAASDNPPAEAATVQPAAPASDEPQVMQAQGYQLRVEVIVEQLQVPIHHMTGSTDGRRVLGRMRRAPGELAEHGVQDAYWQAVGRDVPLEQRLIAAIVRRSISVPDTPTTTVEPAVDMTPAPPTEGL